MEKEAHKKFVGDTKLIDGHMAGFYYPFPYIRCKYSINATLGGKYPATGWIALIDPGDPDTILKRAEKGSTKTKEQKSFLHVKSLESKDLRAMVEEKTNCLVSKNADILYSRAEKDVTTDQLYFGLAVKKYTDSYVAEHSTSPEMRRRKKSRLEALAGLIGDLRMEDISEEHLNRSRKKLERWYDYFKEAASFLNYILEIKKDVTADFQNEFQKYIETHEKAKSKKDRAKKTEKLIVKATTSDILTEKEEKKLRAMAMEHIDSGELMGVVMILDTGFSTAKLCDFNWDQVIWTDKKKEHAILNYRKDEYAGAVHNYSFPLFPSCVRLLKKRYQYLGRTLGFSDNNILKLPLISVEGDPTKRLEPSALTAKCKYYLRDCGTGYAKLARLPGCPEGGGVTLLQNTYKARLKKCGFDKDDGLLKFMLHQSLINMVQANNYRCFTDSTAVWMIETLLRRDDLRFASEEKRKVLWDLKKVGSAYDYRIESFSKASPADVEMQIKLEKGEKIEIEALYGCEVSFRTNTESEGKKDLS